MKVAVTAKAKTWDTLKKRADPLTSIALTIPVFLLYHLGILLVDRRGGVGVDLVSSTVLDVLKASPPVYVVGTLTLALVVATVTWIEERRGASSGVSLSRVLLEGAAYGVALLAIFGWATSSVMRAADPAGVAVLGVFDKLVLAAGAGFHEEFIFRAVMVTGVSAFLLKIFRVTKNTALTMAVVASSVLFSLAHHYGPHGEPFVLELAGYRVLLGGVFAGIYLLRGFAVVVYAHTVFQALIYFVYA